MRPARGKDEQGLGLVPGKAGDVGPVAGREDIPFGFVVPAPAGAGVYAQMAAWLGRTPDAPLGRTP